MVNGLRAASGIFLFAIFSLVSYVLFSEAAFFFNKYLSRQLYAPHKVAIYTSFGDESLEFLLDLLASERKNPEHSLIDACEEFDECGNILIVIEDWAQLEKFYMLPDPARLSNELSSVSESFNFFSFNVVYEIMPKKSYIHSKNFYIYSVGASPLGSEISNCIIKKFVSDVYRERGAVATRLGAVDISKCEG